jgi:ArsR family transcriptional regulator
VATKSAHSGSLQAFKAEFFKTLGHPVRIRILERLIGGERSVQDLQEALDLEQPIVSQHLAMLRAKNIVRARKEGTTVWYTVRVPLIGELLAVARRIFDSQLIDSQTMLRELRREGRRR